MDLPIRRVLRYLGEITLEEYLSSDECDELAAVATAAAARSRMTEVESISTQGVVHIRVGKRGSLCGLHFLGTYSICSNPPDCEACLRGYRACSTHSSATVTGRTSSTR